MRRRSRFLRKPTLRARRQSSSATFPKRLSWISNRKTATPSRLRTRRKSKVRKWAAVQLRRSEIAVLKQSKRQISKAAREAFAFLKECRDVA
jgi:hypothetical protein